MEARENYEYGEDFARHVMPALGDLCRAPLAPVAPRDIAMQALARMDERQAQARRPMLESVESLQAKVLNAIRKDALAQIQDAIQTLAETEAKINQLIAMHGLGLRALFMQQPGRMWYDIETMLDESNLAEVRLARGGLPLHAEPQAVRGQAA
ncbi:hypothetical protein [Chromobacterium subtsugae]|uniref:hypothetical protein n=1 Tax=Chromobacterium subtsugae TaxID=251747 RepID=UPI0007F92769|nr:hypothetical protein [Chromobacterium subtsugae]OBU84521.1 hypothetical protein MY55_21455 [Chromobacterium subtsugae]